MEDSGGLRRKKARYDRDWTEGNILHNLLSLAWPIIISQTFTIMGPTIDMIWLGRLGTASIAGVGISTMVVQIMNAARMGLQTGTRAMVARFVGADDMEGANHVGQQAFVITVAFSIVMAIIGALFARQILGLFGLEPDVVEEGAAYMRIHLIGMVTMSFQMMTQGIMQASGDTVTPMKVSVASRIFHIALCPFLIFGWWIFPMMGVSGAALTGVIAQGIAGGLGLWILCSGRTRLRLTMKNFKFDGNMIWRITRIGIPAMVNGAERNIANLLVTWFVVPFGTAAVAAHSLLQRVDRFINMPSMGMGQSAGVLAGQNLGAGKPERAERTGWTASFIISGFMFIIALIVWFWADQIIRIFNTDPELVKIASTFLRITIVSYLVFGFVQTLMRCLNGLGDTIVPMLTTLLTMWGVQVPVAYFLSQVDSIGVYGIRWGLVSANVMRAVIYTTYFKLGRWKKKSL